MIKIKDMLTVVITTHVLPSAPSTKFIKTTIDSIRESFNEIEGCTFIIYCDSDETNESHKEYLENIRDIDGVTVIDNPHPGRKHDGLQTNYIRGLREAKTPFVLCCEHDWLFLRKINTRKIIECMTENDEVNFIRFNKRDNRFAHIDNLGPGDEIQYCWEHHVEEANLSGCSLMKTDAIATHPHIIRVSKFMDDWLSIAEKQQICTGAVEVNLHHTYNRDIESMGFSPAHKLWGVYNYGCKDDDKIIIHQDGSNTGRV